MTVGVPARWCLGAAVAVAVGILLPLPAVVGVAVPAVAWAIRSAPPRRGVVVLVVLGALGAVSGSISDGRAAAVGAAHVPAGVADLVLAVREDPLVSTGWMAVAAPLSIDGRSWDGPPLAVGPLPSDVVAGDRITVRGRMSARPHRIRNDHVAGTVRVLSVAVHRRSTDPFLFTGNALRSRVRSTFARDDPADGLVTGLLIGDTERVPPRTMEDLRRAGLAHFVAVSGSNVALFLGALWIVGAPIAVHPRLRSILGLMGLLVFIVMTRWEPSVIRASAMAAVPMVGSLAGVPVDPWMALGTAVTLLLLVSADLLQSVGFQLSVAATVGVLAGIAVVRDRRPRWLWMPVAATMGAQIAVAPIIVAVFGTVPLVAPVANLVAAPIVTIGSVGGIAAVLVPFGPLIRVARTAAGLVIDIAEVAAGGPQLTGWGVAGALLVVGAMSRRRLRPLGLAAIAFVALGITPAAPWPSSPTLIAFDIGQGDAIAILDPTGAAALVDGGRDPGVLDRALRRHGIARLDLVVATHGDADHAGGLVDLIRFAPVGELWVPDHQADPALSALAEIAGTRGIPVRRVRTGDRANVGGLTLEVLGPGRRYQADNDGSIVLMVNAAKSALLPGDIEAVAQRELPDVHPDILVVPHHGAGTSDRRWLERVVGPTAVLSYGTNAFGHPHPEIVAVLEEAGARVLHTHLHGDVVIGLG